jgi:hypothetical protein
MKQLLVMEVTSKNGVLSASGSRTFRVGQTVQMQHKTIMVLVPSSRFRKAGISSIEPLLMY